MKTISHLEDDPFVPSDCLRDQSWSNDTLAKFLDITDFFRITTEGTRDQDLLRHIFSVSSRFAHSNAKIFRPPVLRHHYTKRGKVSSSLYLPAPSKYRARVKVILKSAPCVEKNSIPRFRHYRNTPRHLPRSLKLES